MQREVQNFFCDEAKVLHLRKKQLYFTHTPDPCL